MADLSAHGDWKWREYTRRSRHPIADGVTLYRGALAQVQSGYINHYDGTGYFLGLVDSGDDHARAAFAKAGTLLGDSDLDTQEGQAVPAAWVAEGAILRELDSVAGTPTQAKNYAYVWCADSDPDNLTLTAHASLPPVGKMVYYRSATDVDVQLFTPIEYQAIKNSVYNLTYQFDLADIADGDLVTDFVIGHQFQILENYAILNEPMSTASKGTTIGLEIGSTAVTNSAVTLDSDTHTTAGEIIDNAGTLAANTGSATDTLTVIASSTTTIGEGKINYVIRLRAL